MTNNSEVHIVGTNKRHQGQRRFRCVRCRGPAWLAESTIRRMAEFKPDQIQIVCQECISRRGIAKTDEVVPFNDDQMAHVHSRGLDLTKDQINAKLRELYRKL